MTEYTLFATCPRGLEEPLAAELQAAGCTGIRTTDGGASCKGKTEQVYRTNLWSRTASRILLRLTKAACRNEDDLYRLAKNIRWADWFTPDQTFKVAVEGRKSKLKRPDIAALKIKDALCDAFRETCGRRPSVDKARPDVRIHAFIDEREAQIFIDTSGEALFKRGYRQDAGEAPLRENLAAGLLLLAGYDGTQPFQDPFCGSGTIVVEAAWIATGRAPGLMRRFGFERLKNFDAAVWTDIRRQAEAQIKPAAVPIAGSDNDRRMIQTARANAQAAQVGELTTWTVCDVRDARPDGDGGIMVSNPPYGVRLSEIHALQALYPQLGAWLKQHYAGWRIGMFTADRDMPKHMRLSPKRRIPLYNGNLDCRLFLLEMVAGSNR